MEVDLLVGQYMGKNSKAFQKLYEMYRTSLFGVIHNIVRDEVASEEILNDVFLKIWQRSDQYNQDKGRFFTWILNIARNSAIDYTRSKTFKKQKKNQNVDLYVNTIEVDDQTEDRMDQILVIKALKNLKEKCIEIIDSIFLKGYTQSETSEKLDIPLGTVKTRSRSCLKELRDKMQD